MPNPMGQAAPSSPFAMMAGGDAAGGASDQQPDLSDLIDQIKDVSRSVDAIVGSYPSLTQEGQQVKTALRNMLSKAAQNAPDQNASAMSVPPTGA